MWLVLFNPQSKGQQRNGPQSTQAETQLSLLNNHVQLSLRPVSNSLLIALFLITLPEVTTLYLAGDWKSPAHILEHHLWNPLVNKSILAFIPYFSPF